MKRNILLILAFMLLGAFGCAAYVEAPLAGPAGHHPESAIEISLFYDSLAPYGDWFWVDPWGWVWTPWDVEPGWRPYTHGHWAWTALGWAWVSDEAWGWAPFHYGRWNYHSHHGWIWVPDTVWAPAWVAWRSGNGWIGWAPLPPDARWRAGIGLDLGGVDLSLGIVPHGWCFVHERDFREPRIWRHLEPLPRHQHLLRDTADRTRYEEVDRRVAVRSIPVEEIERNAGPVRRIPLETLRKPPAAKPPAVVRPPAQEGAPAQPPPSLDKEPPERRTAREQRELRAWEREQRERLDRAQVQERRQPPPDEIAAVERERRQQEERRALQKEVERERQLVENRRERRAVQVKEKDKDKPKVQEKPRKPAKPPEG